MSKLFVTAPSGAQEIIEIGAGGGYYDPARVLWDDRLDGPLPVGITLGGMVRQGDALVFDQAVYDDSTAAWVVEQTRRIIASITDSTQKRLDDFARTRNCDGILSACTYAASTVPKFAAEGQYCVERRDATWAKQYAIMAEVEAGARPMPTGYADIEAELPPLAWPT